MTQQIRRFSVGQTAKVAGVLYALMGLIFMPLFLVGALLEPKEGSGFTVGFALALPLLYAVLGYAMTAVGCACYNWVAGKVGGIEFELATVTADTAAAAVRSAEGAV